jgi:hypothetical protein
VLKASSLIKYDMETHKISSAEQLIDIGLQRCVYDRDLFYGPLNDRIRQSGAYIDPSNSKIKVIRIMTGKKLFNDTFTQYISTSSVIWNLPTWQTPDSKIGEINVSKGDPVDVYVSLGTDLKSMQNFFAGNFIIDEIQKIMLNKNTLTKLTLVTPGTNHDDNV